ncbi:MAG: AAA family ATPase [Nitrospirae bacterium]|nr:AAA family ATPase [Nitrospirota bacterium]
MSGKKDRKPKMDELIGAMQDSIRSKKSKKDDSPNAELMEVIQELQDTVVMQNHEIARLNAAPWIYGTVLSSFHEMDPSRFEKGDRVVVIDKDLAFCGQSGLIVSDGVEDGGNIRIEIVGIKKRPHLRIGTMGDQQVKLLGKSDGTNITIAQGGKIQEVWGSPEFDPSPGDTIKVNSQTGQVHEISPPTKLGSVCNVAEIVGDGEILVEVGGEKRIVICPFDKVEVGDDVVLDPNNLVVVRHEPNHEKKRFKLKAECETSWEDIGGVDEAKTELLEAIVKPHQHPEFYKFYNYQVPKGFLLYGPPGCGKTMLGKATAKALAGLYDKASVQSGFNYLKGPELLSHWVGESERETRAIFQRMRKHFEVYGYPAVTFVDEADAIFTERGKNEHQPWQDSLVAMWLAEMDGFDSACGILILATNRPKAIDGAFVREGRIDRHIKVPRPNREKAVQIFKIHLRNIPLHETDENEVAEKAAADLLEGSRPLYELNCNGETATFCFSDCVSGSLIAGVVSQAKSLAMRRNLDAIESNKQEKPLGIQIADFQDATALLYKRHTALNHRFDLEDFYETAGFDAKRVQVEKNNLFT